MNARFKTSTLLLAIPAAAIAGEIAWMASDSIVPVFAAAAGAVIAVLALDGIGPWAAVGMVSGGVLLAAFIVPGIAEWRGITSVKQVATLSGFAGMFGLQAVRLLTKNFELIAKWVGRVILKRLGFDVGEE